MKKNENYETLDRILGPDGRHNPCAPNRGDEQEGSDFILTLAGAVVPFEKRLEKFLPKENKR